MAASSKQTMLLFYISIYFSLYIFLPNFIGPNFGVQAFDPYIISSMAAAGGAYLYDKVACRPECCNDKYISLNTTGLRQDLERELHGQHLVTDTVIRSLRGHFTEKNPSKALVLSFHGGTGTGKNFVSKIISRNIYKKGMNSKYVRLFVATHHFPHEDRTELYKEQIKEWIRSNVTSCERTMFIFDEMDKMPVGVIDTIKAYIDHYEDIDKVNYRKSIFIFLSNSGGTDITERALEHWKKSKKREELELKDFEQIITMGAFNEEGGLWHSTLIVKNLISSFIPFLPMERQHVKQCIEDDIRSKNRVPTAQQVEKVANMLQYYPDDTQLYSKSGCKRVSQKVDLVLDEH